MQSQGRTPRYDSIDIPYEMSISPTISNFADGSSKRRRTDSDGFTFQTGLDSQMNMAQPVSNGQQQMQQAIPKRGQRACTACRKGKNRCEGEVSASEEDSGLSLLTAPLLPARPGVCSKAPCRRCQLSGTTCIFEKPEKKNALPVSNASVE